MIGQQYMEALLQADANEVWRMTDHQEFEDNGMSKEDLRKFLETWLQPRILRIDGASYDSFGTGSSGFQTYSWGVATKIGRIPLPITVAKCDEGLRVVQPLTAIFTTFCALHGDRVSPAHSGQEVMRCWWQNGLALAPELEPYHFTKIQQSPSSEPISIKDFALHNREKLLALSQRPSSQSAAQATP